MSHHLPYCLKSSRPQYECLRSQDEHEILLTWSAMVIIAFFFQFLSVPFLSCLRRLARKSKWAKEDKRSAANTGFTRLYPRGLFWLLVTWKPKVKTKNGLPLLKALTEILWGDCNPQPPPPLFQKKKFNLLVGGNEKIKAKQNKIKIARCLTGTKLWKNAIIFLKLIDLRPDKIELKNFFFDTEIIIQYRNFMVMKFNE